LGKKTLWISLLALAIVLFFFELTNTDIILQEWFFSPVDKTWLLKDPHKIYRAIFYTGIKIPIYIIGLFCLYGSIVSIAKNKWNEYRKGFLIVILTLVILPSTIALVGKRYSNVQCPEDVTHFGGNIPYVKLFDSYPKNPHSPDGKWFPGHCFPAGHASGGFGLISLVFLCKKRKQKILAFLLGLSMGTIMGGYQMLRGAHFISHNIVTMLLAIILISTLNLLIKDCSYESSQNQK